MFFVARGSGRCSQDIFGGHLSWLQRRREVRGPQGLSVPTINCQPCILCRVVWARGPSEQRRRIRTKWNEILQNGLMQACEENVLHLGSDARLGLIPFVVLTSAGSGPSQQPLISLALPFSCKSMSIGCLQGSRLPCQYCAW